MKDEMQEILDDAQDAGWVMEPGAKAILEAFGLPVTRHVFARDEAQAVEGAASLGYPVVAKVVSPKVVHKSDAGGVVVGIRDEDGLRAAFERLGDIEAFEGVLIDEMAAGVEMFVGSKQDPQFGTVVLAGIGGTSVEVYEDVAIRAAPMTREQALVALAALKGRALLEGFRGAEPVDREALAALISRFSEAAFELRETVDSIDLNPVLAGAGGALIADARMMLHGPGEGL